MEQEAERLLKKSMEYARGTRNKASIYTQTYMSAAIEAAQDTKQNKPFWEGLAKFHRCQFNAAMKLFRVAAKTPKGRELIRLIMDDRRLEHEEVQALAALCKGDPKRAITRNKRRRAEVEKMQKRLGIAFQSGNAADVAQQFCRVASHLKGE